MLTSFVTGMLERAAATERLPFCEWNSLTGCNHGELRIPYPPLRTHPKEPVPVLQICETLWAPVGSWPRTYGLSLLCGALLPTFNYRFSRTCITGILTIVISARIRLGLIVGLVFAVSIHPLISGKVAFEKVTGQNVHNSNESKQTILFGASRRCPPPSLTICLAVDVCFGGALFLSVCSFGFELFPTLCILLSGNWAELPRWLFADVRGVKSVT